MNLESGFNNFGKICFTIAGNIYVNDGKITGLPAPDKNPESDSLVRYKNTTFHVFLIRGFFLYSKDVYGGRGGLVTYLDLAGGVDTITSSSELSCVSWRLLRSFVLFAFSSFARTSNSYERYINITKA